MLFILSGCENNPAPFISEPTFEKNVKPIFHLRCTSCHGSRWQNYQTVIDSKDKIEYKVIKTRTMPPGGIPAYEYDLIKRWLEQGAK